MSNKLDKLDEPDVSDEITLADVEFEAVMEDLRDFNPEDYDGDAGCVTDDMLEHLERLHMARRAKRIAQKTYPLVIDMSGGLIQGVYSANPADIDRTLLVTQGDPEPHEETCMLGKYPYYVQAETVFGLLAAHPGTWYGDCVLWAAQNLEGIKL